MEQFRDRETDVVEKYNKQLKSCPFCGGLPVLRHRSYGSGNYGYGHELVVECKNCAVTMTCADVSYRSLSDCQKELSAAVEKWNKRRE